MEVHEIRLANLRAILEDKFGGVIAQLARAIEKDSNQTRFILFPEKPGGRNIGEKQARQIEKKLSLAPGALDNPYTVSNSKELTPSQCEVREAANKYAYRLPDEIAQAITRLIRNAADAEGKNE